MLRQRIARKLGATGAYFVHGRESNIVYGHAHNGNGVRV